MKILEGGFVLLLESPAPRNIQLAAYVDGRTHAMFHQLARLHHRSASAELRLAVTRHLCSAAHAEDAPVQLDEEDAS
jgi:hypothetical protein